MAKGSNKPIGERHMLLPVSQELLDAHETLVAKRTFTIILRSKALNDLSITVGDLVQVNAKRENQKRVKWLCPRAILPIDTTARIITVPGTNGKKGCCL